MAKTSTTKKPLRAGERKLIRRTSRTASEARVDRDSVVSVRVSAVVMEPAVVFRASNGGRRWFTRAAAIKTYTANKLRAKHGPCECEGDTGFTCDMHAVWERVMPRYRRVVNRAIAKAEATQ